MTKTIVITGASGRVCVAVRVYLCWQGFNVIGVSRSVREDSECYTDTAQIDLLDEGDLEKLENFMDKWSLSNLIEKQALVQLLE